MVGKIELAIGGLYTLGDGLLSIYSKRGSLAEPGPLAITANIEQKGDPQFNWFPVLNHT
jgi:hypothetical protein